MSFKTKAQTNLGLLDDVRLLYDELGWTVLIRGMSKINSCIDSGGEHNFLHGYALVQYSQTWKSEIISDEELIDATFYLSTRKLMRCSDYSTVFHNRNSHCNAQTLFKIHMHNVLIIFTFTQKHNARRTITLDLHIPACIGLRVVVPSLEKTFKLLTNWRTTHPHRSSYIQGIRQCYHLRWVLDLQL